MFDVEVCVADSSMYAFKSLCIINFIAFAAIGWDHVTYWYQIVIAANIGWLAMVVMQAAAPTVSFVTADVFYSGSGMVTSVLVFMALRASALDFVITVCLAFAGFGVVAGYAQEHVMQTLHSIMGDTLSDLNEYLVVAVLLVCLGIVIFLYQKLRAIVVVLAYCFILSLMIGVGLHSFVFNNSLYAEKLCCKTKDITPECPVWFDTLDVGLVMGFTIGRIIAFTHYKFTHVNPLQKAEKDKKFYKDSVNQIITDTKKTPDKDKDNEVVRQRV